MNHPRSLNQLVILEEPFVGLWCDFRTPLLLQALACRAAFPQTDSNFNRLSVWAEGWDEG